MPSAFSFYQWDFFAYAVSVSYTVGSLWLIRDAASLGAGVRAARVA
jgi:hypothetical protein